MILTLFPISFPIEVIILGKLVRCAMCVFAVIPPVLACVALNKYIFKSADMISGAING